MADEQNAEIPEIQATDTAPVLDQPAVKESSEKKEKPKPLRDQIRAAMTEVKEKNQTPGEDENNAAKSPEQPKTGRERDEAGKFASKEAKVEPAVLDSGIKAPESWKADAKAEWAKIPPGAQAEIARREADIHKAMTQMDTERHFAKEMQTAILPYMPLINQSQSTPAKAVTELFNYAHILQTGNAQSKGQLLWQLAQRWGADMRINPQAQQQPGFQIQNIQQELASTKQQLAQLPGLIKQQQEEAQIKSVIEAFASDPKNVHYERIKGAMAALLSSGVAKDMKDAYERACYADPEIRSTLEADKAKSDEAKRVADLKAKAEKARNASGSVKGSAGLNGATVPGPKLSLRDELRKNLRAAQA